MHTSDINKEIFFKRLPPGQMKIMKYLVDYFMENLSLPVSRQIKNAFAYKSQTASMSFLNSLTAKRLLVHAHYGVSNSYIIDWDFLIRNIDMVYDKEELKLVEFVDEGVLNQVYVPHTGMIALWMIQTKREIQYSTNVNPVS